MSDDDYRSVPRGRLARFGQFGRLAGGVAGGMIAEGARRLADGQRPSVQDMLLTPANARRLADRLAHLRGAAMKLGQMISLDAGEFLPDELGAILARLRDQGYRMPPQQLQQVLNREWGTPWRPQFRQFNATPIAAASIGQVHRATTRDGRELAIKVQYPGVADSIDADVENVATLLRLSGLLPSALDIAPLLTAAKEQLAREADYRREANYLQRYGRLLANDGRFVVPTLDPEFSNGHVLAMSFVGGKPIETLEEADQSVRDTAVAELVELVLRELFEFRLMQTDPNFANYRVQPDTGRLVLLDFGAAQEVEAPVSAGYARLLAALLDGDVPRIREAAVAAGFLGALAVERHGALIDQMIRVILEVLERPGPFDFGDRAFVATLREQGMAIAADRDSWHLPPATLLFVQRKVSGTALLAARLKARVDLKGLVQRTLTASSATVA
ncbi:AarF/ABC1/UbiB kinase family protein [Sphingomonas sp. KRR8]|uniref:ABC1 kinase family protein n=1 Tax=Sphingomonas sp. KRR8 TaxID=2942996 RepID=UPI00202168D6|nr:AarF/ABC1/UbiB kinase family protein [Sphingomonas sp. KRR8]URD59782.1 AarF/ABC1/UbiB kinase family protein [Sphingomonas sp. KRR8]